jgi:hypothetical protein
MVFVTSLSVSLFSYRFHVLTGHVETLGQGATNLTDFMSALHTVFWAAACVCLAGGLVSVARPRSRLAHH